MGLFVLESSRMEHVPGTTRYFDDPDRPQIATSETVGLKCDTSGPVPIILVPQPSDDPNDPLNWPLWKRDLLLFILSIVSIFATCLGPILAANTLTMTYYFGGTRDFTQIALLTGYYLLGVGVASILFVPSARIWGKRHQFLLATAMLVGTSAWAGASTSYQSLAAARAFQGVATAPFETLVNACVGDMYFVHQRGKRMALTNLAVFGGAFFTPIVVGKMTHTIGWQWSFYFVAIFTAVSLPFVIFYVPETAYRRAAHLNTDLASTEDLQKSKDAVDEGHELLVRNAAADVTITPQLHAGSADSKMPTFKQSLMPFNGRHTDESFVKLMLRPFVLFAHPAIIWACLIQGAMIGWTVFIGIILAAIFLGPPLFWNEEKTGYAYAGAFIGAIFGFFIAGALADWSAKFMTRRNNGIYEPEFRILLVIPQLVFGCGGLYLFGVTASRLVDYHWMIPIFAAALEVCGMVIGAVAASLYLVDAHRDIAIEAFTCTIIFKNFFSYMLTYTAYDWIVSAGVYKVFMWISSIQVFICLLSIPMYVFGKKNRSFFHRHDMLKATGLN